MWHAYAYSSRDEGGKGQSVGVKHVQKKSKKLFKKQPPRRSKSATSSRILTGGMTFDGGQGKSVEHKESTAPRKHIKVGPFTHVPRVQCNYLMGKGLSIFQ